MGFGGLRNCVGGGVGRIILKNVVSQGLRNVLHALGFERSKTTKSCSGPNPRKLSSVRFQEPKPRRHLEHAFYEEVLHHADSCKLAYADAAGSLKDVDRMIEQDNLYKAVEGINTTTTGNLYGKQSQKALEIYVTKLEGVAEAVVRDAVYECCADGAAEDTDDEFDDDCEPECFELGRHVCAKRL